MTKSTSTTATVFFTDSGQALGNFTANAATSLLPDLDNDGDLDYVSSNIDGDSLHVYLNDGNGFFTEIDPIPSTGETRSATCADFDSDGDIDIVQTNNGEGNHVYLNDGTGQFTDTGQVLAGGFLSRFATFGDINGDGSLDLVWANGFGPEHVFLNNGSALFSQGASIGNVNSFSCNIGDIDNDGDLDLLVGVNSGINNLIFFNE